MHFIKGIFAGSVSDWVHDRFIRYGRGEFNGPAVTVKRNSKIKVDGSPSYANILGKLVVDNTSQDIQVSGKIIVKREINVPLNITKTSKKGGVIVAEVKDMINSEGLRMVYDEYPDAHILLDLVSSDGIYRIKCKKSLPKPGSGVDKKFVSAVLDSHILGKIREEILFDVGGDFKNAEVSHKYVIEELIVPSGCTDAAKKRLEAKRKGRVIRTAVVDGVESKREHEFVI